MLHGVKILKDYLKFRTKDAHGTKIARIWRFHSHKNERSNTWISQGRNYTQIFTYPNPNPNTKSTVVPHVVMIMSDGLPLLAASTRIVMPIVCWWITSLGSKHQNFIAYCVLFSCCDDNEWWITSLGSKHQNCIAYCVLPHVTTENTTIIRSSTITINKSIAHYHSQSRLNSSIYKSHFRLAKCSKYKLSYTDLETITDLNFFKIHAIGRSQCRLYSFLEIQPNV